MLLPHQSVSKSTIAVYTHRGQRNAPLHNFSLPHSPRLKKPLLGAASRLFIDDWSRKHYIAAPHASDGDQTENLSEKPPQLRPELHQGKSFWAAVSLIIGTAVGPGMLGLPALTIRSGPLPSTISILLSWVYVISSIILVAELSFATMEEDGVAEVSFTGLATKAFGSRFGAIVALIYASLSFSLLVACVSGIGSLVSEWFPWMNSVLAHALFPFAVGIVHCFLPFTAIDAANRLLCFVMLISITALVVFGLSIARSNVLASFAYASWIPPSILPTIPVTVLTLGFHVITPFICKIAGNTVQEARKAILIGGAIPLIMVMSWNLVVLGLVGSSKFSSPENPISLLLSVNPSALPAVQGFAFSALATSLIGYTISFPKQLLDTMDLILNTSNCDENTHCRSEEDIGRVGLVSYSGEPALGNPGKVSFIGSKHMPSLASEPKPVMPVHEFGRFEFFITPLVLGVPILVASYFRSTFSRALDFAGVYANCFLFGILPPVMTYIYQSRRKLRYNSYPS